MTLKLVSIGLNNHLDLSLRALEETRLSDKVYFENYTMKLETSANQLSEVIGKPVVLLQRNMLEEGVSKLLEEAANNDITVLVGGDALSATTHISLLIDAKKQGIKTRVIHGASIITAIAETGLSLYKFGRTVTVPLPRKGPVDTVIKTLRENKEYGLHTLALLDLNVPKGEYLSIPEALRRLFDTGQFPVDTLVVGVARLGTTEQVVKAGDVPLLLEYGWGEPPYVVVVPGNLHFLEEEALKILAGCPPDILEGRQVTGELQSLIEKYSQSCRRVLDSLKLNETPIFMDEKKVKELLDHTERYLTDAQYYRGDNNPVALTCISYAEGILDALKLLGLTDFNW